MNLYLVYRTHYIGWDEYDSFVCAAENEEAARLTWPSKEYPLNGITKL
jgi:hypothetical protein